LVALVPHGDEKLGIVPLCRLQVGLAVVARVGEGHADALKYPAEMRLARAS
jgi:hypothetical protein